MTTFKSAKRDIIYLTKEYNFRILLKVIQFETWNFPDLKLATNLFAKMVAKIHILNSLQSSKSSRKSENKS